jgi:hypothetical protein
VVQSILIFYFVVSTTEESQGIESQAIESHIVESQMVVSTIVSSPDTGSFLPPQEVNAAIRPKEKIKFFIDYNCLSIFSYCNDNNYKYFVKD